MKIREAITDYSIHHYKLITWVLVLATLGLGALIPLIRVDTDPENMLSEDEPVRVFHDETKKEFDLSDIVVVGVVNEEHPDGVFNVASLNRIYELAEFSADLQWPSPEDPDEKVGVIEVDMMAPSVVDHIGQGDQPGVVTFEWLMPRPPKTEEGALAVRDRMMSNPMLMGTLVSEDGRAISLYLPLTSKDLSYRVYSALNEKVAGFEGPEEYHITGLPVAEDTFGVEMFIQMAISAPLAMVVIFLLMLLFFRKLVLIISPMIVAMVAVISTMGLLIGFGFPVHIMSSMIPIFLMPIAVVDSVHILSEFFDLYTAEKGRKATVREVMSNLFTPMLYTSLTSAAGFASLALTPIPPVQVFGVFVAVGIMIAWLATVLFVPAYVMMIPERSLRNFGHAAHTADKPSALSRVLHATGGFTYRRAGAILAVLLILSAVAVYGITQIRINDNPVKWFAEGHPIRQADEKLNDHFGGTYMAYLVLSQDEDADRSLDEYAESLRGRLDELVEELKGDYPKLSDAAAQAKGMIAPQPGTDETVEEYLSQLAAEAEAKSDAAEDLDVSDAWYELAAFFQLQTERLKTFKQPEVLQYMAKLQDYLAGLDVVGKSNSVADIVSKVYQELTTGEEADYRVPENPGAVAQSLIQYQSSHRPHDLWHFVNTDYSAANIWIQLTSGDNQDMQKVVAAVDRFWKENPPPAPIEKAWAGLTYINVVWQEKMVSGMLQSFMGSFLIVFIMMAILFRSPLWGLLCMVPLTITILIIYGVIGLIGKDYDMPVAVLSALTLGMAVDFAIHFLQRARETYAQTGSWREAAGEMFGEPARAITRNVLVIAIGFLPLLAAPLVPYKTVGIFLCAIMALSGAVTLLALPALIRLGERVLFRRAGQPASVGCSCGFCTVIAVAGVALILLNVHQYGHIGGSVLLIVGVVAIPITAVLCNLLSRRQACNRSELPTIEKREIAS